MQPRATRDMWPAPSDILQLPGASVSMWLSLFIRGYGIWKHVELHLVVMRLGARMFHYLASGARDVRGPEKGNRQSPRGQFHPKCQEPLHLEMHMLHLPCHLKRRVKGDSSCGVVLCGKFNGKGETVEQGRPWQPHSPIPL